MRRIALILLLTSAINAFGAFGYYSPISINSGQVPSTQTDFPILIKVTDARFKTVGNGGHVQDAQGDDIRPYTNSGLGTAITGYEKVFYDGTAGTLEMWVKISSLSSSTTPCVLAYGDSGLTSDGSSTTTWSNSFLGVYHLADGTTLNVNSSTGSNNGTNHSATATTGQIDGAGAFASASTQYIGLGTAMHPLSLTISAWINGTTLPTAYNTVVGRVFTGTDGYWLLYVKSNGKLAYFVNLNSGNQINADGTGSNTLSTGTWYHVSLVFDNGATTGALKGYVNGSQDVSANIGSPFSLDSNAATVGIGWNVFDAGTKYWNGKIDETRIASVARSANWITTEYNNQSAPGTFETLGTEVSLLTPTSNFFLLFP